VFDDLLFKSTPEFPECFCVFGALLFFPESVAIDNFSERKIMTKGNGSRLETLLELLPILGARVVRARKLVPPEPWQRRKP